jgi:bifunctional NMN adenylyltransferase/nudix hydrolase
MGRGPFVTADAVVVQSGHILLVERGRAPGKGLLALPGGFVNPEERIRDAAIRELREETSISDGKGQIPPAMLASFIEDARTRVFDAPNRSLRGRIITHAFLFRLPERRKLFGVKGRRCRPCPLVPLWRPEPRDALRGPLVDHRGDGGPLRPPRLPKT